ncbi:hypothetical protein GYMLUDRAFT_49374 [Collybiopsis luxurians FD-317 M1]|uniref:C2H2-type domain-containing protein n=1 Tax=Collybiopsis luxurians FD-317 M1 TaxID=944289 RepID=A0A0D0C693_9AGAR|nr:hypothetical protein GYMLUDRAFT_49374 [Collybiopsis luxurians FD-317 M1]
MRCDPLHHVNEAHSTNDDQEPAEQGAPTMHTVYSDLPTSQETEVDAYLGRLVSSLEGSTQQLHSHEYTDIAHRRYRQQYIQPGVDQGFQASMMDASSERTPVNSLQAVVPGSPVPSVRCLIQVDGGTCGKALTRESYIAHFGQSHNQYGVKQFRCPWPDCRVVRTSRQRLFSHLESHLDKNVRQEFPCEQCQRAFNRQDMLVRHKWSMHLKKKEKGKRIEDVRRRQRHERTTDSASGAEAHMY